MDLPFTPMLLGRAGAPFVDPDWVYQVKWDGVRNLSLIEGGQIHHWSRNLRDRTALYPEFNDLARALPGRTVLDGEIIVIREGKPSFAGILERDVGNKAGPDRMRRAPATFVVFDLLEYDGRELYRTPLSERLARLAQVLPADPRWQAVQTFPGEQGPSLWQGVLELGLEGVVAKRANSPYRPGVRTQDWLKIKRKDRTLAVIVGWTTGGLLLGAYDQGQLRFIGRAGSGMTGLLWDRVKANCAPGPCPFPRVPSLRDRFSGPPGPVTWTAPSLTIEIQFTEWTESGYLRDPVVLALSDRPPEEAVWALSGEGDGEPTEESEAVAAGEPAPTSEAAPTSEPAPASEPVQPPAAEATPTPIATARITPDRQTVTIGGRTLVLTNLTKLLWPDDGITKAELIAHYVGLAPVLLPYLKDRPLVLTRYPNGIHEKGFYYKAVTDVPDWIPTYRYGEVSYLLCQEAAALAWVANLAAVELHPWLSRHQTPENPDWAVIDIDPSEGATFDDVLLLARLVKQILDAVGVTGFPKFSGATGIHVYCPCLPDHSYVETAAFAEAVARLLLKAHPSRVTLERMVAKRENKVYIDYPQNRRGQTITSVYGLRPRPGAPVSTPLTWAEIEAGPPRFTIRTIGARLEAVGDLFAPLLTSGQDLRRPTTELRSMV